MFKRSFFNRKKLPIRVHIDDNHAVYDLANQLLDLLPKLSYKDLVIVCIGTDRSTGDALGPIVGSKLEERSLSSFHVYGTLEDPVHAVNLEDTLQRINLHHKSPFIIAIDACLGRSTSVGCITIADGPVKPGAAVNKKLPPVVDIHMTGIVNVGGFMEYMVLQNTRLHLVVKIAEIIATSIKKADDQLNKSDVNQIVKQVKPSFF